jgi:hypothetical protein
VVGWQVGVKWFGLMPIGPGSFGTFGGTGFLPWQPLTFPFIQGEPRDVLWMFLGLFFFLQTTVDSMGLRRMAWSTLFVWFFACVVKFTAEAVGFLAPAPVVGFGFWVEALVVWFGLLHRGAQIRLMFVLPIKAEYMAWGSGVLALLYLLFYRDTGSLHAVAAWVGAWAVITFDTDMFRRWRLQQRKRKIEKELGKFEVIDGGRTGRPRRADPNDWVN